MENSMFKLTLTVKLSWKQAYTLLCIVSVLAKLFS